MRWLTFALFVVLAVTLQSTLVPRLELFTLRPDWLLVAVVFLALYAPRRDAVVAAWVLGAAADLMTLERLGLISLTYGLVAAAVVAGRGSLFRERAITQFVITLAACLSTRLAWCLYRRVLYDPATAWGVDVTTDVVLASVYTAVWAPLLHRGLLRGAPLLGLARPRYSYAGLPGAGG